jgi:hypothetical protein
VTSAIYLQIFCPRAGRHASSFLVILRYFRSEGRLLPGFDAIHYSIISVEVARRQHWQAIWPSLRRLLSRTVLMVRVIALYSSMHRRRSALLFISLILPLDATCKKILSLFYNVPEMVPMKVILNTGDIMEVIDSHEGRTIADIA